MKFSDCKETQCLLSWNRLPKHTYIEYLPLKDCHEFIRKATLHASKVTQHYEAKVLLLLNVLVNYSLRATYVLQLDIDI